MKLREQLIEAANCYCSASGMSSSRLSTVLLSGGMRLKQIENGGDIGVGRFEQAIQWLSDNWPDNTPWPEGVYRPAPTILEAAQ